MSITQPHVDSELVYHSQPPPSKECGCFGVRATRLINAMKAVNPNLAFVINPERAPKGSFELKTEAGKTLWKMEGLKRPFPTFKSVDYEALGAKLAKEL